jgi:hypothetical protein
MLMEIDEPAFHDPSGRWFSRDYPCQLDPHQAAAVFMWHYRPLPAALVQVVRELLDGTGDLARRPPESRQRAPRRPAPHEAYAHEMYLTNQYTQTEIADIVTLRYQRSCNQGQVSKWIKKVRAWDTGEIYKPYPRYPKRTVNMAPKCMERTVENPSDDDDNPASCGGGIRVIKKSLRDPYDNNDD